MTIIFRLSFYFYFDSIAGLVYRVVYTARTTRMKFTYRRHNNLSAQSTCVYSYKGRLNEGGTGETSNVIGHINLNVRRQERR